MSCVLCVYTSRVWVLCVARCVSTRQKCALCVYTTRVWVLCAVLCVSTHQGFECYVLCFVCLHIKGLSVMCCTLYVYTPRVWVLCTVSCLSTHQKFECYVLCVVFLHIEVFEMKWFSHVSFFLYLPYLFFWSTPMFRNEILNQRAFVESSDLVFELLFINK